MAAINADPEVGRWLAGTATLADTEQRIHQYLYHWQERGFGLWAVEELETGRLIGRIGLVYHDDWTASQHDAEIGWTLAREAWGRGYATEGAHEALRWAFEERGLDDIISITQPGNVRSRRVMEKVGLTYRGQTQWRGFAQVWYGIERDEWERLPK